jgi:hypothetical protein
LNAMLGHSCLDMQEIDSNMGLSAGLAVEDSCLAPKQFNEKPKQRKCKNRKYEH